MADRRPLTEQEIAAALPSIQGWSLVNGRLHRELLFDNFIEAFRFMTGTALIAERMNHHPDWSNVYNRVVIDLSTHDAGGITSLDLEFARRVNALLPS
jgi:4a-hydroxytetrahydrobiopterin dehydratase